MAKEMSLDKIDSCISCGRTKRQTFLDRDHYFPKCMARHPVGLDPLKHPLREVVYRKSNVFRICRDEHQDIDREKTRAFGGEDFSDVDPVALVTFLRTSYPLTSNRRYYDLQLRCMMETNQMFARAVWQLNGEFTSEVKQRFHRAAVLALVYNLNLKSRLSKGN